MWTRRSMYRGPAMNNEQIAEARARMKEVLANGKNINLSQFISQAFPAALDEIERLRAEVVAIYNAGYAAGHHDTVESCYVDVLPVDARTYHADVVAEIFKETNHE